MAAEDESVLIQMFDQAASAGAATTDRTTGSDCDGSRSLSLDLKGSGAGGGSRSTDHFPLYRLRNPMHRGPAEYRPISRGPSRASEVKLGIDIRQDGS
jgi:hypothetical protein